MSSHRTGLAMIDKPTLITETARITPVGLGWATIVKADPSTQVTLVAGVLTCVYLIAQTWFILRRARRERRRLEMEEAEHASRMRAMEDARRDES